MPETGPSVPEAIVNAAATIRISSEYPDGVGSAIADWLDSAADRWDQIRPRWEGQYALAIALAATQAARPSGDR